MPSAFFPAKTSLSLATAAYSPAPSPSGESARLSGAPDNAMAMEFASRDAVSAVPATPANPARRLLPWVSTAECPYRSLNTTATACWAVTSAPSASASLAGETVPPATGWAALSVATATCPTPAETAPDPFSLEQSHSTLLLIYETDNHPAGIRSSPQSGSCQGQVQGIGPV